MKPDALWSVVIAAPRERVWSALTQIGRPLPFLFGTVLETELRPGAPLRYCTANGKRTFIDGTVVEVSAPHRLVHTFRFTDLDEPPGTVTFTLEEESTGTRLTVTHEGLGPKHRKRVTPGWTKILTWLRSWIERGRLSLPTRLLALVMKALTPLLPNAHRGTPTVAPGSPREQEGGKT